MSIFDILSPDFRNELPDDPRLAFGLIVERTTDWLSKRLAEVDESEQSSWRVYEAAQLKAMNVIIASAKHYEVKPFADMVVPTKGEFNDSVFDEFQSDLDHYVIQMVLDNAGRARRDSAIIDSKAREKIRDYINGLKRVIDEADVSEAKRSALRSKLQAFEGELDKARVPVFALARILLEVVSLTANVAALHDSPTFHKLISNTFHAVAVVKAEDDQNRQLPPSEPPRALLPPRPPQARGPKEDYDLNDDIPF